MSSAKRKLILVEEDQSRRLYEASSCLFRIMHWSGRVAEYGNRDKESLQKQQLTFISLNIFFLEGRGKMVIPAGPTGCWIVGWNPEISTFDLSAFYHRAAVDPCRRPSEKSWNSNLG